MKNVFLITITMALLSGCSSSSFDQPKVSNLTPNNFSISDTNEQSFNKDVLLSRKPVLVDFYATWCGPCKMMAPIIDGVASQYQVKIKVMRVDIDRNPQLASRYNIQAIPTIAVFNQGKLIDTLVGVVPPDEIVGEINNVLQSGKMIGSGTKNTSL